MSTPDTLSPQQFYEELTKRNSGLIAVESQAKLRAARIVVAGCGSTGGAAVLPLVRTGATRFLLADPDRFELSNLNRQNATLADIGENKAAVAARSVEAVNPHASVEVLAGGIPASHAAALLTKKDVIIDAIDVTTMSGIAAKRALHEAAVSVRVPVITAYDIAACQFIEVFDYRSGGEPFAGKVGDARSPEDVLGALIPPTALPEEILPIISEGTVAPAAGFPQLAMTAQLFGALVVPIVLRILGDQPLPAHVRVDLFGVTTPRPARFARRVRTLMKLPVVWLGARRKAHR
ncbi:MAG: ThiF family adenylyltransferase [Acidimicrobiia bacterium]|nr:ThiF family adenylyltransferase [Acidimicrobiia bacterium]